MAKEAYYFSHDYGARNDPKLQEVLMKLGQEGVGVYWCLVEMLFEEGGRLLILKCDSYAFALRTTKLCINSLINDFDLFKKDRKFFWSNSVLKRIKERDEKSEKAKASANSRWKNANAQNNDATALRTESDGNAIKESKGNKSKEDTIYLSDASTEAQTDIKIPVNKMIEGYDRRKEEFRKSLLPFTKYNNNPNGAYSAEMIKAFFEYWYEPNKSRSKMKWESEKTWDLNLRLSRWANNSLNAKKLPNSSHEDYNVKYTEITKRTSSQI